MAYGKPCDKFSPYQMPPYNYRFISDIANNQGFIQGGGGGGEPGIPSPPSRSPPSPKEIELLDSFVIKLSIE